MSRAQVVSLVALIAAGLAFSYCGTSTTTSTTPVAVVVATPAPTPVPAPTDCELPHDGGPGCAPPCYLGPGTGSGVNCPLHGKADPFLFNAVAQAVTDQVAANPNLASHDPVTGIITVSGANRLAFFNAVVNELNTMPTICAAKNGLEIAVKDTNAYSEQYKFWLTTGVVRTDSGMLTATCTPAWF